MSEGHPARSASQRRNLFHRQRERTAFHRNTNEQALMGNLPDEKWLMPAKGGQRAGRKRGREGSALRANGNRLLPIAAIQDDGRERAIGIAKGDILDPLLREGRGLDSQSAGENAFGGMAQHVVLDIIV